MKGTLFYTSDKIFDIDDFDSMNENNLPEKLEHLIRKHLKVHRDNFQYHVAVNQAILSNKELFKDYGDNINQLMGIITQEIQETNEFFKTVSKNSLKNTAR